MKKLSSSRWQKKVMPLKKNFKGKNANVLPKNIDKKLLKRVQSKEFENSVDQAVRSFMYDLDFLLLEEQHLTK
ncbi:MAG: hypothetical protein Ct9H300mP28_19190 [Pseudomonadota bacterium]|nr:MAG: hypothetical protein Ct9H300mP28_19190 [Pseudomonadota bacterium]